MKKYYFSENYLYFLTYRTKTFQNFLEANEIKEIIYNRIKNVKENHDNEYFAYSILNNHVHLMLLVTNKDSLTSDLQMIFGGSAREVNKKLNREGSLWGRSFALSVKSQLDYYRVLSYILSNPIRHGIVPNLNELYNYKYCNYRDFCVLNGREMMESLVLKNLRLKIEEEKFWKQYPI